MADNETAVPRLTKEQAAIIGAYTGILCGDFDDMVEYIDKLLGRPTWTHDLANPDLVEAIKEKAKNDFFGICNQKEERNG